jgi:hypothetical protein
MKRSIGPMQKLMEGAASDQKRLAALRAEFESLRAPYYFNNMVRQEYLLTRAKAPLRSIA